MYPHRIRLRGPWECEPIARMPEQAGLPLPPPCRMTLPCRWNEGGLGDFTGRARFRRRFGYPGQIDSHERVWLTFAGVDGFALVRLNGQLLGRHEGPNEGFEFDVTRLLDRRNELVIEVESSGNGGLSGEVALEIRSTAFLHSVRTWTETDDGGRRLHVTGEVVGTSDRPLDLYALLDGATVIYGTLEPAPTGKSFHLQSELLAPGREGTADAPQQVRVELVNGAVVWYVVEQPLPS